MAKYASILTKLWSAPSAGVHEVYRVRLGPQGLAMVSQRKPQLSVARPHEERDRWVAPTYTALHHVLTNPVYAGAYAYGKCRHERYVDDKADGATNPSSTASRMGVLLPDHHQGFIDCGNVSGPINPASTPMFIPNLTRQVAR